jgi:hypothetical protein
MLFEAPRRHLNKACSVHEERTEAFVKLDEVVTKRLEDCRAALSPSMKAGRIRVSRAHAVTCAAEIEQASWRLSLREAHVGRFPACGGLLSGAQQNGEPCRVGIECAAGLVCDKTADAVGDGSCQLRTAKSCDAPASWLFGEERTQCGEQAYCDGTFRNQPAHHLGFSPSGDAVRFRDAAQFGILGRLNQTGPARTPWGDSIGDSFGVGGLGLSGIGEGGGGERQGLGTIGTIGKKGTPATPSPGSKPPRVRVGAVTVGPRLPREVIQRVVRQNFGRFRLCYQTGLKNNPDLAGKVTVRFVISRDGRVTSASAQSSLPDQGVVSCVRAAFYGLHFPKPQGGIVTVSYPIVFSPSDAAPGASTSKPSKDEPPPEPSRLACVPRRAVGAGCEHETQCTTGICRAGHCEEALGRSGEACHWYGECEPKSYCAAAERGGKWTCQPLRETGQACERTGQCEGACIDSKCAALCGEG